MIRIRKEKPADVPQIRKINQLAFETAVEADLVDKLRHSCPQILSLVAQKGESLVGHLLFSPAFIDNKTGIIEGMGLAPMAVLPNFQRQEIGSQLVLKGIEMLHQSGCPFIIVLGHPKFYPRFGFELASLYGLTCQWEGVPEEAFMVLILDERRMKGISGEVRYREEFNEVL